MNKSIKRNYIYNLSYQILLILTPLITTPYISRMIGASGIGKYSFADSISSYFVLFATLGTSIYGQRQISYVQNNKYKRSKLFWENVIFRIVTVFVALVVYIFFVGQYNSKLLFSVLALNIVSVSIDFTWFFQGIEEFGKIVIRNFITKFLSIIYIFIFVKKEEDLVLYVLGIVGFNFISNISLWYYIPRYIQKIPLKKLEITKNLKIIISLFIPTIAIQIYAVLDKTMIGIITNNLYENGYYDQAQKIARLLLTIVTSLGVVMIPRIGYHYINNDKEKINDYIYRSYRFVWFIGIPLCLGLIGIANNFVPWFFGNEFAKVIPLLQINSLLILTIGINNVTGVQYLIPTEKQNIFTLTVVIGAVVNFTLNLFLIKHYASIGATISSVIAEFVIAVVQLVIVKKELNPKRIIISSKIYWIAGIPMFVVLYFEGLILSSSFLNLIIMFLSSSLVYFVILIVLKDEFLISIMNKVKFYLRKG